MRTFLALLLFCSAASAAPKIPQLKTRCTALADYRPICQTMTQMNNCSTQLNTTCCDCAAEWNTTFSFCSFSQQLFPTPTPTPSGSINCAVAATDNLCNNDKHILTFDAAGSTTTNAPLTYTWNYTCEGATNNAVQANTTDAKLILDLDDPKLGAETTCAVSLTVADAASRSATCSSALVANNCLTGCVSTNQQELLINLDGTAKLQFWNIRSMVRTAGSEARSARILAKYASRAQKLYLANWNATYTLPVVTKLCSNSTLCVSASNASMITFYKENSLTLKKIAAKVYPIALKESHSKWRPRIKALKRRANALYSAALSYSAQIPPTASSCGAA